MYSPFMSYVYSNPYKGTYEAARQELAQREAELKFVTLRISQLKETIRTLEPLANSNVAAPTAGLSELCAQVLQSVTGIGMTANDVINALAYRGINVSDYSNPLAVIHTTLTRLCKPDSGFWKGAAPDGSPLYVYDERLKKGLPMFKKGTLSNMR
jgi:hypothetical protein